MAGAKSTIQDPSSSNWTNQTLQLGSNFLESDVTQLLVGPASHQNSIDSKIIPISFPPEKKNNSVTICKRCRLFLSHKKRARAPKHSTKKMKKKKKNKKNLRGRWRPRPGRYYQRRWLPGKGSFHRPGNQCSIDSNWCTSRWRRGRPSRRVSRGRRCRCRSARPIWSEAANRKCASRCPWPASRCSPSPSLALCNSSTEAFRCVCAHTSFPSNWV